jgi:Methylase involved in ubiquinone/menaquinone biosynthesis
MSKKDTDNKIPIYQLESKEKVLDYYINWTENNQYNQDMVDWNYSGPKNAVKIFKKYAHDKSIVILDAGCGTGLVAEELVKEGFSNFIGVDFSKEMLNLVPTNLYRKLELVDLNNKLNYSNNHFDAVICVGTFTYGHVKAHALNEFLRIIKQEGLICFTVNEGIYEEYNFDNKIRELEQNKKWQILELKKTGYIVNKDIEAWVCIARKM